MWTNGTAILKKEEEAVTFMLYPNGPIRNFILYFVFEVSSWLLGLVYFFVENEPEYVEAEFDPHFIFSNTNKKPVRSLC